MECPHWLVDRRCTTPNEPGTFVFHMTSWSYAAKILTVKFQERFADDFKKYGTSLLLPQTLFKINSEGFYKPKGNVRTEIQKGATAIDGAIKDLQCQFNDMAQTNQQEVFTLPPLIRAESEDSPSSLSRVLGLRSD